jgi:lipid-binding SYLF domain-containing protein
MTLAMRQTLSHAARIAAAAVLFSSVAFAADQKEMVKEAKETVDAFKEKDKELKKHLDGSVAYAVLPRVQKGGFLVAGGGGEGVLFEKGVAVGKIKMSQVTFGAQVGGQSFSELIIFKTADALKEFKDKETELEAGGTSAVAGNTGTTKNLEYKKGVAIVTMVRGGMMAEASVGGQKFEFTAFEK